MFATPNAHRNGGTADASGWLLREGVLDPGPPPGVRLVRGVVEHLRDRADDLVRLRRRRLDLHRASLAVPRGHPFEGFRSPRRRGTPYG